MTAGREVGTRTINIRPGVGVYAVLPSVNYKVWYAVAEFVDNSLDSYLQHHEVLAHANADDQPLRVTITLSVQDGGSLRVWDNAAGISAARFQDALTLARPPASTAGLSRYGMGMKAAACWLARNWEIRSSAIGEPLERSVSVDVTQIVKTGQEELEVRSLEASENDHFTELRLWNLRAVPQTRTISKIKDHLASIYRVFLREGLLELIFNGEQLRHQQPALLSAPWYSDPHGKPRLWREGIHLELPSEGRIDGWVGILQRGSTERAGLALFQNHRLILGSGDETYRPHAIFGRGNSYRYQRLTGELELNGIEVSHTKDGFLWDGIEHELIDGLRARLDAPSARLLQQAEQYRAREDTVWGTSGVRQALQRTAAAVEDRAPPALRPQPPREPAPPATPAGVQSGARSYSRHVVLTAEGLDWVVTINASEQSETTDWLDIADQVTGSEAGPRRRHLRIRFSLAHPFMVRFRGVDDGSVEPLLRLAVAIALAETMARDSGVRYAGDIRRRINELLRNALSQSDIQETS